MRKKNYLLVVFFVFSILDTVAQIHMTDINGRQINAKYTDVQGSPYLIDDWAKGIVKLKNGNTYKDVDIKYDEVDQKVLFKAANDSSMYFVDPISEFKIVYIKNTKTYNSLFRTGYGEKPTDFYEVLADGGIQLLKLTSKTIKENRAYGEAVAVKSIDEDTQYYLCKNGNLIHIKKDKKSVFNILGNKANELEVYIKANNLNLKNDDDLSKLIMYYNSI